MAPPKVSFVADWASSVPCPVRLMTCGLLGSLSVIVSVPLRVPTAEGLKVILMLQLVRVGTLEPHKLVSWKSPVVEIELMVMGVMVDGFVNCMG